MFLGTYKALGKTKVAIKRVKGSEHGGLTPRYGCKTSQYMQDKTQNIILPLYDAFVNEKTESSTTFSFLSE